MTTTRTLSPRIGFAYDLTGGAKHILRGGYACYYGNVFQNIPLFMIQQANPTIYQGVFSITSPTDIVPGTGIALGNWRYGVDPFPIIPPPLTALVPGATGRLMDRSIATRSPNNLTLISMGRDEVLGGRSGVRTRARLAREQNDQTSIRRSMAFAPLSAAFVAAGVPNFGRVMDEESINRSRYDGLNFSYRQRMTRHFSLNANYTLSRAYGLGGPVRRHGRRLRLPQLSARSTEHLGSARFSDRTPNDERHHVNHQRNRPVALGIPGRADSAIRQCAPL